MSISQSRLPLVLIGGGGHASVLADILMSQGREISAVISPDDTSQRCVFDNIPILSQDQDITQFSPGAVRLVNGIGMLPFNNLRSKVSQWYRSMGYCFETVVAESAQVSKYATLGEGVQVFPGAIVQAGVDIGDHAIVNTGALVEHDCQIGAFNHLAPRATICGGVKTEATVFVGANATVTQGVTLSELSVVGAGAVLSRNLPARNICYPSRNIIQFNTEE
ncbi:acetyltransferase [Photobacterium sp. DNB22_13_2]